MILSFFIVIKVSTGLLLFGCFMANSWLIFHHYIVGKTVTASKIMVSKVGTQKMPAIVICRENAFSGAKKEMSTREDYLNNTLKLNYWIQDPDWNDITAHSDDLEHNKIYSFTRGNCEVFRYKAQVRCIPLND